MTTSSRCASDMSPPPLAQSAYREGEGAAGSAMGTLLEFDQP